MEYPKNLEKHICNIELNETPIDIILGLHNPNNDLILCFLNFVNLCAKTYLRENENKDVYVNVFLIRFKELCNFVKNKNLIEFIENNV